MKILVLIDKFKNSMSSNQLGKLCKSTLKHHEVDYFPISDGGDGFLDTIYSNNLNIKKRYINVYDALMNIKRTYYLIDNQVAYIEVAKIIGYNKENKLDVFNATTYGVGQVILDAIKHGIKTFYIGLGGSITNDGGKGMLEALGYSFNNIVINNCPFNLNEYSFNIISDVNNPLLGNNGATYVFSKQKGAKKSQFKQLEERMIHYSNLICKYLNKDYTNRQGAGAAGGLGFAFISILNANYLSGIDFTLNYLNIDKIINKYDLIITGEGKVDKQSLNGKIVFEITNRYKKDTLILCAIKEVDADNIYSIVPYITTKEKSLKYTPYYFKKLLNSINILK